MALKPTQLMGVRRRGLFLDTQLLAEALGSPAAPPEAEFLQFQRRVEQFLSHPQTPRAHRSFVSWLLSFLTGDTQWIADGRPRSTTVPSWGLAITADYDTAETGLPGFLVVVADSSNSLDRRSRHGHPSPRAKLERLLRGNSETIGLITNGQDLRLVHAPRQLESAELSWDLTALSESPTALGELRRLCRLAVSGGPDGRSKLADLAARSLDRRASLTIKLQARVRLGYEALIAGLDHTAVWASSARLQTAGLIILMRLVFLLYAEERGLLPLNEQLYRDSYSLLSLSEQLEQQAAQGHSSWLRILALSRLIHGGSASLGLVAYGGALFDPQRFPELESLRLTDQVLQRVLSALLYVEEQSHRRRVSYEQLDVEQLGHLYEGLLDLTLEGESGTRQVVSTRARRHSGSYYTPRSLTEAVVRQTLEPLTSNPENGEVLQPRQLLALKVCDPAVGSGAFLVQAARYLADRLVESWEAAALRAGPLSRPTLPYAEAARNLEGENMLPLDDRDRALAWARRLVVERCLYGIDQNPLAVEIARLSLWLVSFARERPFTFVDHAIRSGDSLLGVGLAELRAWNNQGQAGELPLFEDIAAKDLERALCLRKGIVARPALRPLDTQLKAARLEEADAALDHLKLGATLLTASARLGAGERSDLLARWLSHTQDEQLHSQASTLLDSRKCIHWPLEFPEVFVDGSGFDAVIGNPPFQGGQRLASSQGSWYRDWLVKQIAGRRGSADLAAYFLLRAFRLLAPSGNLGFVTTNSLAQGTSRVIGLGRVLLEGGTIYQAVRSKPWPGDRQLEIAIIHIKRDPQPAATPVLNGLRVATISSRLDGMSLEGFPPDLLERKGMSYEGSILIGDGFIITPSQAAEWMRSNPENSEVLFPYLSGRDLNRSIGALPQRWVIDFGNRCKEQARRYQSCWEHVLENVRPCRLASREKRYRERWWIHGERRPGLYRAVQTKPRVLARSRVSVRSVVTFVDPGWLYSDGTVIFIHDEAWALSVLQSGLHEAWATSFGSTLRRDLRYSPTRCYETFPFPPADTHAKLSLIGDELERLRRVLMAELGEGLQGLARRIASKAGPPKIRQLRDLHRELDLAVVAAYDLNIPLDHGFRKRSGISSFAISESCHWRLVEELWRRSLKTAGAASKHKPDKTYAGSRSC